MLTSAEARLTLFAFLERGLGRAFRDEVRLRETGVLEGLDGGLPLPMAGNSI